MDWSDEHYVKLYTRDSLTWKTWHWETRTVFLHLVRKVSSSGFIEVGTMEPAAALALQLDLPLQVVGPGIGQLLACGTAELVDGAILLPKYVEAQEAKKSEAQKKRDYRERTIAKRRAAQPAVTPIPPVHRLEPTGTDLDPPSPALPVPVPCPEEEAAPSSKNAVAFVVTPPTTPPEQWSGEDFWRWAQGRRQTAGMVAEKGPPRGVGAWYSQVLLELNGNVERLKEAFYRFGEEPYWQKQKPPLPWNGFVSQLNNWIPREVHRAGA